MPFYNEIGLGHDAREQVIDLANDILGNELAITPLNKNWFLEKTKLGKLVEGMRLVVQKEEQDDRRIFEYDVVIKTQTMDETLFMKNTRTDDEACLTCFLSETWKTISAVANPPLAQCCAPVLNVIRFLKQTYADEEERHAFWKTETLTTYKGMLSQVPVSDNLQKAESLLVVAYILMTFRDNGYTLMHRDFHMMNAVFYDVIVPEQGITLAPSPSLGEIGVEYIIPPGLNSLPALIDFGMSEMFYSPDNHISNNVVVETGETVYARSVCNSQHDLRLYVVSLYQHLFVEHDFTKRKSAVYGRDQDKEEPDFIQFISFVFAFHTKRVDGRFSAEFAERVWLKTAKKFCDWLWRLPKFLRSHSSNLEKRVKYQQVLEYARQGGAYPDEPGGKMVYMKELPAAYLYKTSKKYQRLAKTDVTFDHEEIRWIAYMTTSSTTQMQPDEFNQFRDVFFHKTRYIRQSYFFYANALSTRNTWIYEPAVFFAVACFFLSNKNKGEQRWRTTEEFAMKLRTRLLENPRFSF